MAQRIRGYLQLISQVDSTCILINRLVSLGQICKTLKALKDDHYLKLLQTVKKQLIRLENGYISTWIQASEEDGQSLFNVGIVQDCNEIFKGSIKIVGPF
ncbi:hypothetical protein ABPG72_009454 [Tetrahymena utriculariae]